MGAAVRWLTRWLLRRTFGAFGRRLFLTLAPRAAVTMTAAGAGVGYESPVHDLRGEVVFEAPMPEVPIEAIEIMDIEGQLPRHPTQSYPRRDISKVTGRVWHHTATTGQSLNTVASFHINSRGWAAIGYHVGVGFDGKIYLLNSLDRASYHTAGHNARNVGVVLVGNFEKALVPEAMEKSIEKVREWLDEKGIREDRLHRELGATACPGRYAVEVLRR